jgi:CRP-like cAMP-binding protein
MNGPACPNHNRILNSLTAAESGRIFPNLSRVWLGTGAVLCDAGDRARYVYFPTDAVLALVIVLSDGTFSQIGMIGNEGESGIGLVMGGESWTGLAVVQIGGFAYRMPAAVLHDEMRRRGSLSRLLLRHAHSLFTQTAMLAVCNRHHSLDQQLCRWLLLTLDRVASSHFKATQEQIANLLGVRREGVTAAAGRLQHRGAIRYCHGRIAILDRGLLEELCCECYSVVRQETDRLLPMARPQGRHDRLMRFDANLISRRVPARSHLHDTRGGCEKTAVRHGGKALLT